MIDFPGVLPLIYTYLIFVSVFWISVLVITIKYPEGRMSQTLNELRKKPYAEAYKDAHKEILSRLPLSIALILMLVTQMSIASQTLPESRAIEIANTFSIAGFNFGPLTLAGLLVTVWVIEPKAKYVMKRAVSELGLYTPNWEQENESG